MLWLVGLWFWFFGADTVTQPGQCHGFYTVECQSFGGEGVSASYRRVLDKAYDDFVVWTVVNQRPRPDTLE